MTCATSPHCLSASRSLRPARALLNLWQRAFLSPLGQALIFILFEHSNPAFQTHSCFLGFRAWLDGPFLLGLLVGLPTSSSFSSFSFLLFRIPWRTRANLVRFAAALAMAVEKAVGQGNNLASSVVWPLSKAHHWDQRWCPCARPATKLTPVLRNQKHPKMAVIENGICKKIVPESLPSYDLSFCPKNAI